MESGNEGSTPPLPPKLETPSRFSGINKLLKKLHFSKPRQSPHLSITSSNESSANGAILAEVSNKESMPENLVKPEIPIPGEAPIPEGNIRLFHFTYPKNLDSIRTKGLTAPRVDTHSNSSDTGRNSTWVYSDLNFIEPPVWTIGMPYLEFSAPPDEMSPRKGVSTKGGTVRTLKPGVDIPPEQIVAIHEPWHEMVRHSNGSFIDSEWLKSYIERSVQIAGDNGTRGNRPDYSEMAMQQQYLESQVMEANKYLNFPNLPVQKL